MEVVGCDLADGVSVGVHFVNVFAQGNIGAVVVFATVFGIKCMDGAFAFGGVDFDYDVGTEIVCESATRRGGIGWVVEASDVAIVSLKVNGRGFTLGRGNSKAAVGQAKEVVIVGRGKTEVTEGMNEGEVGPVFVEGGGVAI